MARFETSAYIDVQHATTDAHDRLQGATRASCPKRRLVHSRSFPKQAYLVHMICLTALVATLSYPLAAICTDDVVLAVGESVAVTLTNGDRLSGVVSETTTNTITLKDSILGLSTLNRNQIASVESAPSTAVAEGVDLSVLAQQVSLSASSPQTNATTPKPAAASQPIYGFKVAKLKIAAAYTDTTQQQQTYSGELDVVRNWFPAEQGWPHQRSLLTISPTYDDKRSSKPDSANITRNYNAIFQQTLFTVTDDWFVPVFGNLYHNNSLGMYLQQSYGAGIGHTMGALELDADLQFVGEHFYPSKGYPPNKSLSLAGIGLQERYDLPLSFIHMGATFTEAIEFLPILNDGSAWQGHGIAEVSIPFTQQLSFVLSAFDNYIENAPPTYRKNYFKTTMGIQYTPAVKK